MIICISFFHLSKLEAFRTREINLVIITALCDMLQNWAVLNRAKFSYFDSNHENQLCLGKWFSFDCSC